MIPNPAPSTATYDEKVAYYHQLAETHPELCFMAFPRLNKYIPNIPSEKQACFLLLNDYLEVMYGGAAGGGKTDALLMAALQYVDVPGYSALLLRRTYGQLTLPDNILDRAHRWLRNTDARWEAQANRYVFPSGAKLQFGYLQYFKDVYQYDGAAFQFIGFDELTQFLEPQYRFLFGRLRRLAGASVPIRMRSATNPGNVGHQWVKDRFIKTRADGRLFVPARLKDNSHLDQAAYRRTLAMLDPVTRKQREDGDWDAQREGTIFKSDWFKTYVDKGPAQAFRVRYWDLAATAQKPGKDPDYTVGCLLSRDSLGKYYVEDIQRFRLDPGNVEEAIYRVAKLDGRSVRIRIEQEGGASGKSLIASYVRLLAGWDVKGVPATGSKIARWMPFASQCREGNVRILNGPWNFAFFEELLNVPEAQHDDQADAVSGAFQYFIDEFSPIRPGVSHIGGR